MFILQLWKENSVSAESLQQKISCFPSMVQTGLQFLSILFPVTTDIVFLIYLPVVFIALVWTVMFISWLNLPVLFLSWINVKRNLSRMIFNYKSALKRFFFTCIIRRHFKRKFSSQLVPNEAQFVLQINLFLK